MPAPGNYYSPLSPSYYSPAGTLARVSSTQRFESSVKTYKVSISFKYPAAGSLPSEPLTIYAEDRNEAIRRARKEMRNRGYDRHDGPIVYRARLA